MIEIDHRGRENKLLQAVEMVNLNELIIIPLIPKKLLSKNELDDPDYRLKQLQKDYGEKFSITCSKCHHCR